MRPEHKKKKEHVSKFDKSRNKAIRNTNGIKKERKYAGQVKRSDIRFYQQHDNLISDNEV